MWLVSVYKRGRGGKWVFWERGIRVVVFRSFRVIILVLEKGGHVLCFVHKGF